MSVYTAFYGLFCFWRLQSTCFSTAVRQTFSVTFTQLPFLQLRPSTSCAPHSTLRWSAVLLQCPSLRSQMTSQFATTEDFCSAFRHLQLSWKVSYKGHRFKRWKELFLNFWSILQHLSLLICAMLLIIYRSLWGLITTSYCKAPKKK